MNHTSPYANPGTLGSVFQATEAVFGSPFSLHYLTGDLGAAGNTDDIWDELACLDDGERYVFRLSLVPPNTSAFTDQ